MRAVVVREFGGPDALEIAEVPVPEPGRGQVRIQVAAAGVNPVDIATRAGWMNELGPGVLGSWPTTGIGWDVAGTVAAVGPGVTGFAAGDQVIGLRDRLDQPTGGYATRSSWTPPTSPGCPAARTWWPPRRCRSTGSRRCRGWTRWA